MHTGVPNSGSSENFWQKICTIPGILSAMKYKDVSLGFPLKLPIYVVLHRIETEKFKTLALVKIFIGEVLNIARIFITKTEKEIKFHGTTGILFEYLRPDLFAQLNDVLHLSMDYSPVVFTSKTTVEKKLLNNNFDNVLLLVRYLHLTPAFFPSVNIFFKTTFLLKKTFKLRLMEKMILFFKVWEIVAYIDLWEGLLNKNKTLKKIFTLSDAHCHENIATQVCKKYDIETFTLQHGIPGLLWFPVLSDNILLWGRDFEGYVKKNSPSALNTVVVGKLGRVARREEVSSTQNLKIHKNNSILVSYYDTNWGLDVNTSLLSHVIKLLTISTEIQLIIKLRPGTTSEKKAIYKSIIAATGISRNIDIVEYADNKVIYKETDIIISCHSGALVEAFGHSVIPVIMDFYPEMNLSDFLPHYEHSIVVRNESEFMNKICRIINNRALQDRLKSFFNKKQFIKEKTDIPLIRKLIRK